MYSVIAADPPWSYNDKKMNRGGAARHYQTMKLADIQRMNVGDYAAKDSICLMWATAPLLKEGIATLESWGFKYKTLAFVWVKRNPHCWSTLAKLIRKEIAEYRYVFEDEQGAYSATSLKSWFGDKWLSDIASNQFFMGMGSYTRGNAELVLLGVKGKAATLIDDHGVNQIIDACISKHSAKPQDFFDKVQALTGSCRKLELFGRSNRDGWDSLGDQIDGGSQYYLDKDFQLQLSVSNQPKAIK